MALDTSKIIHAPVGGGRYTVTSPIVKEDYGLYLKIEGLELPSTYEVDFSNSEHNGTSVTMIGNADGVLIPSQFISSGKDVFAFLYHVGDNYGRTVFKFRIPNKLRPDRTNEQPTPEQQSVIDQAIAALNDAVAQTAQDVIDADASAQSASDDADRAEQAKEDASTFAQRSAQSAQASADYSESAQASATASAQSASQSAQIKDDVEGMVDDAQASATASAQSATASANSASQASASATSASQSATSAQGYASQAQTSAQTASSKASEASTSASTASAKASESAQSATNAQGYANTAESAKTASQTAQGLAESARDSAISAKDDAESARDEAQNLVDGISGKVEQIDSNTERIESLEDDRYKPYAVDMASGAVASFSDGADDIPLKSLIINIDPVQDTSSGDPSPENICPISGWTEVQTNQSGVNVWDEEWEVGRINPDTGKNHSQNDAVRSKNYIPCIQNTEYYYQIPSGKGNILICFYDADKSYVGFYNFTTVHTFITPANCCYMRFCTGANYGTTYNHDISINYPSTDHDYHPYTGRSITISLGQTVYGGKLDVLSGVLTVDRAKVVVNGNSNIFVWTTPIHPLYGFALNPLPRPDRSRGEVMCDKLSSRIGVYPWNVYRVNGALYFCINDEVLSEPSLTGAKMWLADNPLTVVYPLADPIEIQLFPNQVNSLLGVNNIWADSGDTEVEYRADTKLFIERLTAPDSADMIADANITSGQYFMVGNNLFKATANIANGSAIVVGTNCTRKSLSEALNEINA